MPGAKNRLAGCGPRRAITEPPSLLLLVPHILREPLNCVAFHPQVLHSRSDKNGCAFGRAARFLQPIAGQYHTANGGFEFDGGSVFAAIVGEGVAFDEVPVSRGSGIFLCPEEQAGVAAAVDRVATDDIVSVAVADGNAD